MTYTKLFTEAMDTAHNREADRRRDDDMEKAAKSAKPKHKKMKAIYKSKNSMDYSDIYFDGSWYWSHDRRSGDYINLGRGKPAFDKKKFDKINEAVDNSIDEKTYRFTGSYWQAVELLAAQQEAGSSTKYTADMISAHFKKKIDTVDSDISTTKKDIKRTAKFAKNDMTETSSAPDFFIEELNDKFNFC